AKEKAEYGFNPRTAFLSDPEGFNKYKSAVANLGSKHPLVEEMAKEFKNAHKSKAVKTHQLLIDQKKLMAAKKAQEALTGRAVNVEDFRQGLIYKQQQEAIGTYGPGANPYDSIPKKLSGGMIRKDGPIFAHGGEMIIPKGFALGGPVVGNVNASLNNTITIAGGDELVSKIKNAIEKSTPRTVKVDTEGASVPVDTEGSFVAIEPASVESLAGTISDSISAALANVPTDTGSVGADEVDKI
ncbi:unnamed protein product, partial [marine sediment metagenome]